MPMHPLGPLIGTIVSTFISLPFERVYKLMVCNLDHLYAVQELEKTQKFNSKTANKTLGKLAKYPGVKISEVV
jgi:hypothetical protein